MLVNGVDISMLEGWMVKINSNPSFFGKNMNRRWFKVGFVPGPGEKKLVISYSSSKTAKDPRGWLYVEDVSGIYCRREMIEIVSPSRTLRLKGETAVEHRLWSDSLYKLCNPPPKSATAVVQTTQAAEPRSDRTSRRTQRETKQVDEDERDKAEERAQRKRRADRERERERERESRSPVAESRDRGGRSARSNRQRDDSDDEDSDRDTRRRGRDRDRSRGRSLRDDYDERDPRQRRSPSPKYRESREDRREEQKSSRHEREESRSQPVLSRSPSEHDQSDDDSSEDDRSDSPRPSTNSSTRSLLVAQIKSGSSFEADVAQCKNVISDSEDEDEDDYHLEKEDEDPEEESPREPVTSSTNAIDEETCCDELEQMNPKRVEAVQPISKRKNSDYFDSDDEQEAPPPTKSAVLRDGRKAPASHVAADNNFAHDDWDAEEDEPTSTAPTTKYSHSVAGVSGGVAADANFAHEDWDD